MSAIRKATLLALTGLMLLGSADYGSARTWRRHRYAHQVRHFVFANPAVPALLTNAGAFGGNFETGLLGPSTADPYEQRGVGYDGHGYYGPGFGYPGF